MAPRLTEARGARSPDARRSPRSPRAGRAGLRVPLVKTHTPSAAGTRAAPGARSRWTRARLRPLAGRRCNPHVTCVQFGATNGDLHLAIVASACALGVLR